MNFPDEGNSTNENLTVGLFCCSVLGDLVFFLPVLISYSESLYSLLSPVLVLHCTIARTAASKEPFLSLGGCSCPDLLLQKVVSSTTSVRVAPFTKPPPPPLSPERQVMGEAGERSEGVRATAATAASCSALFYLFKSQECRSLKP